MRAILANALSVYEVDHEQLDALEPDLLVTQVQCEVCAVSLRDVEAAVRTGLRSKPAIVSMQPDDLAGLWTDMRAIAGALGVPERGVQLVTRLRARMRGIAERAKGRVVPRVACLEWIEPLMMAAGRPMAKCRSRPASSRIAQCISKRKAFPLGSNMQPPWR